MVKLQQQQIEIDKMYLIDITPQGTISFLSQGYGGRASDVHITNSYSLLEELLPGDMVLARQGGPPFKTVQSYTVQRYFQPLFTKSKPQLSKNEVD